MVRLPGHDPDRAGHGQADHRRHALQDERHAILPAAQPETGQHHLALLVQVLALQPGQAGLFVEEGVEPRVVAIARTALAQADGQACRRADRIDAAGGFGLRLFRVLAHRSPGDATGQTLGPTDRFTKRRSLECQRHLSVGLSRLSLSAGMISA